MNTRRGLFSFGRSARDEQPTGDTSDGSGTGISATPETPHASSSSRTRPRGPSVAEIRAGWARDGGRMVFQRMPTG